MDIIHQVKDLFVPKNKNRSVLPALERFYKDTIPAAARYNILSTNYIIL